MADKKTFLNGNIKIEIGEFLNKKDQATSENYLIEIRNTDIVKESVTLEYMLTHLCLYEVNGLCKINWEGLIQIFRKPTIEDVPKLIKEVAKSLIAVEASDLEFCIKACKSQNVTPFYCTKAYKEILGNNPVKE